MALLLPNLRQVLKYGQGIKDGVTKQAVRALEDWSDDLVRRLSKLEATTGGVTLPIAEADVTGLVTDLAAKAPATRTISTTAPLSGGGDLSANRTLTVADNSTTSKGVVAIAPNDTTKFWRGDATWAVPTASAPTGSLAITSAAQVNVNLSTEGTIDWFGLISNPSLPPRGLAFSGQHAKATGGWLINSFNLMMAGNAMTTTFGSIGSTLSSTGSDSMASTAMSTTNKAQMYHLTSPTNGWGFSLKVPASTTQRVLRVYACHYSCKFDWSAKLMDGSAAPVTTQTDSGSGAATNKLITVTFTAGYPCDLVFTAACNSRYTADPSVWFGGATLSTV